MVRPDSDEYKEMARIGANNTLFLAWLEKWRQFELERLTTASDNVGIIQGRCLVLRELHKLLQEAPDKAANSSRL